ncbi:MAG: hypothetical protein ACMUEL_03550 [Flavobacteriales bacterium Tduv]
MIVDGYHYYSEDLCSGSPTHVVEDRKEKGKKQISLKKSKGKKRDSIRGIHSRKIAQEIR